MVHQIHIFTPIINERIRYVFLHLLQSFTACEVQVSTEQETYRTAAGKKINYSHSGICTGELLIPANGLLFETNIHPLDLSISYYENLPVLFKNEVPEADFPFDIFAYIFFLVTRHEEYLPFKADAHDRFTAAQSFAGKNGFLEKPVVNILINKLLEKLFSKNGLKFTSQNRFSFLPTYDIDMVWSHLHKGLVRTAGSLVKDLAKGRLAKAVEKAKVITGLAKDPAFSFDYLDGLQKKFGFHTVTFFLMGDHSRFDKNQSHQNPAFRQFLQQRYGLQPGNLPENKPGLPITNIGIHPSYYAGFEKTLTEKKRLEEILGQAVFRSRQHYLRLRFPETYHNLIRAGITEDYSMGYADAVGFRAGIATPYKWYNLENEEITNLTIYPFCVMDVTMNVYMQLTPEMAIEKINSLISEVRAANGCFCSLWHNTSFDETAAEWSGWREVYEHLVKACLS